MEYCTTIAASVRFCTGELDHLPPLLGFVGDELSEVAGRARKYRAAEIGKPRFHFGVGKSGVDFFVEPLDDFGGGALGDAASRWPHNRARNRQRLGRPAVRQNASQSLP